MPDVDYSTVVPVPRQRVWEFVRDVDNWAPLTRGYQSHQQLSDREYLWVVKAEVGPVSRITRLQVTVTEWVEGERVVFTVRGLDEPVQGQGAIELRDAPEGTTIVSRASIQFGGVLGPLLNRIAGPRAREGADELVAKIVQAIQEREGGKDD